MSEAELMRYEDAGRVGAVVHVTGKIWSPLAAEGSALPQRGPLVRMSPYSPLCQPGEGETFAELCQVLVESRALSFYP